ncbi:MAG: hypothetical protein WB791_09700 [Waddliaceae bacterium]
MARKSLNVDYQITRLDVQSLNPETRKGYAVYTEPKYRSCLFGIDPYQLEEARVVALGVSFQDQPIGLSIARIVPSWGLGEILTLFIDACHSHRGLGTRLFQQVEKACIEEKSKVLIFRYQKYEQTAPILEQIFKKTGWNAPELFMVRCFFDCFTFHPPWFSKHPPLPLHFQEFPWMDLSKKEEKNLLHQFKQGRYQANLFPLRKPDQDKIEPANSLGLRDLNLPEGEKVIGWIVTQRISPDTLSYSTLYVEPEYRFGGYPIRLLIDSIALQQQSPVRWALFEINIKETDPSWARFVKNRLIPYALVVREIYQTWKAV